MSLLKGISNTRSKWEVRNGKLDNEVGSGNNHTSHLTNLASSFSLLTSFPRNWKSTAGFTLIEFLVVLGILALTVSSTLLFLTSVLRGSNKANVIAEVKQNGQAVLESVERQIRNAVDAQMVKDVNDNDVVNTIQLIRQDQEPLYLKCFPKGVGYNGYIATSADPDASYVAMTNKDDIISGVHIDCPTALDSTGCGGLRVTSSSAGAVSPAIVSICFYASQGIDAPSRQDFEVKDPDNPSSTGIKFQTTISLRRY